MEGIKKEDIKREILLCVAGGCPKAVDLGDRVAIFDDTSQMKIIQDKEGILVIFPKDWLIKIKDDLL